MPDNPDTTGLKQLTAGTIQNPFARLRALLKDIPPGKNPPIDLTLGEPHETPPDFISDEIETNKTLFEKYPSIRGRSELRGAIATWLTRRYKLTPGTIDPNTEILPCNGSREGLFFACLPAVGRKTTTQKPAVLMCNPYYAAYIGAALATNAQPVYLNATQDTGFLPDLDDLQKHTQLLARAAAFYLCSPANPQGAIASKDYLTRALDLARRYDFMLFIDECYSEFFNDLTPPGGLEVAAQTPEKFKNIVIFNSLSKRSNLTGLRSGFCAGDHEFLKKLEQVRNLVAPQMPGPTQIASAKVWSDETHVEQNRAAYRQKYAICDQILKNRYTYKRPAGGFFLWLNMAHFGGSSEAAVTLWQHAGVRVLPGAFLAQPDHHGHNPGADYIRLALVYEKAVIKEALERTVSVLA